MAPQTSDLDRAVFLTYLQYVGIANATRKPKKEGILIYKHIGNSPNKRYRIDLDTNKNNLSFPPFIGKERATKS